MIGRSIEPSGWHPLRFAFESIDFGEKLAIGTFLVDVDDNHIKIVPVNLFHFSGLFDNLFEFIILIKT